MNYDEIEIGSLYKTTTPIYTSDYIHLISEDSCFTIISKNKMIYRGSTTIRIEIIFNELKQVILFALSDFESYSDTIPFKKII